MQKQSREDNCGNGWKLIYSSESIVAVCALAEKFESPKHNVHMCGRKASAQRPIGTREECTSACMHTSRTWVAAGDFEQIPIFPLPIPSPARKAESEVALLPPVLEKWRRAEGKVGLKEGDGK